MRYWKRVDATGNTTTVESYSHDLPIEGAIEITEAEFNAYLASLPVIPPPDNDYLRVCELLKTSHLVITQPEVWELLRLFGKKLGYRF